MTTIHYEFNEHIAVLTIQSPPANALSDTILTDLSRTLDEIEQEQACKAVILCGEGKFFCAGADIKEFTRLQETTDYEHLSGKGQTLFKRIEAFHVPVIAAIHGAALGGGLELAMSCHMRVATTDAKLGLPEMTLGIIPGFAGTQRLPYYVGTAKAYEMILTGEPVSGAEAFRIGLVNLTTDMEDAFVEAKRLADKVASKSKPGISEIMNLVPYAKAGKFDEGASCETASFGRVFNTDDAKEGTAAFLEKRQPGFKDQ